MPLSGKGSPRTRAFSPALPLPSPCFVLGPLWRGPAAELAPAGEGGRTKAADVKRTLMGVKQALQARLQGTPI